MSDWLPVLAALSLSQWSLLVAIGAFFAHPIVDHKTILPPKIDDRGRFQQGGPYNSRRGQRAMLSLKIVGAVALVVFLFPQLSEGSSNSGCDAANNYCEPRRP